MQVNPELATPANADDLAVVLPEPIIIKVPHRAQDGTNTVEELRIMPLPFRKWRKGFGYISVIAPLFGFDLATLLDEKTLKDVQESAGGSIEVNKQTIMQALAGDAADVVYEFLAFAIGKMRPDGTPAVEYFDDVYEQAIDIALAVIRVNINFFGQRLLPSVAKGAAALHTIKVAPVHAQPESTDTQGQLPS